MFVSKHPSDARALDHQFWDCGHSNAE